MAAQPHQIVPPTIYLPTGPGSKFPPGFLRPASESGPVGRWAAHRRSEAGRARARPYVATPPGVMRTLVQVSAHGECRETRVSVTEPASVTKRFSPGCDGPAGSARRPARRRVSWWCSRPPPGAWFQPEQRVVGAKHRRPEPLGQAEGDPFVAAAPEGRGRAGGVGDAAVAAAGYRGAWLPWRW